MRALPVNTHFLAHAWQLALKAFALLHALILYVLAYYNGGMARVFLWKSIWREGFQQQDLGLGRRNGTLRTPCAACLCVSSQAAHLWLSQGHQPLQAARICLAVPSLCLL